MNFEYFYTEESQQFAFYRIPKLLYTDERFKNISSEAKTLYGLLLDRVSLSVKNDWVDDQGRVFVYCTIEAIETALGCADQKAGKLLSELEEIGLIERRRQGLGKPNRIYVKNFITSRFKSSENHDSGAVKITIQDQLKSLSNNTNKNNTDINNTDSFLSDEEDERDSYKQYFYDQLNVERLISTNPYDRETIIEIIEIILDTVCCKKKVIRISGDDKPAAIVKSAFMKLETEHVEFVLKGLKENSTKIRNIKQYILASLYNAPMTISSYYQALYNNDRANGLI